MRIFLDDERLPPDDGENWTIVRRADLCIDLLRTVGLENVEFISFDHDLGTGGTGYEVVCWVEERVMVYGDPLPNWRVHSMNPVGSERMDSVLMALDVFTKLIKKGLP